MKYRLDFVTNSSSSSYVFKISFINDDEEEIVVMNGGQTVSEEYYKSSGRDFDSGMEEINKISIILKNRNKEMFDKYYKDKISYDNLKYVIYSRAGFGDGDGDSCERDFMDYELLAEASLKDESKFIFLSDENKQFFDNFLSTGWDGRELSISTVFEKNGESKTFVKNSSTISKTSSVLKNYKNYKSKL